MTIQKTQAKIDISSSDFITLSFKKLTMPNNITWTASIPNFTHTGQKIWNIWVAIHLSPYIKHNWHPRSFHGTDTWQHLMNSCTEFHDNLKKGYLLILGHRETDGWMDECGLHVKLLLGLCKERLKFKGGRGFHG